MNRYDKPILKEPMTKEELQLLPPFHHSGRYQLIETIPEAIKAVEVLKKATHLGFDTEQSFHKIFRLL